MNIGIIVFILMRLVWRIILFGEICIYCSDYVEFRCLVIKKNFFIIGRILIGVLRNVGDTV